MRTKPISMKKLYQWAGDYSIDKYKRLGVTTREAQDKINEDLAELNRFLQYVWSHRND